MTRSRLHSSILACAVASALPSCSEIERELDRHDEEMQSPGAWDSRTVELASTPQRLSAVAVDGEQIVVVAVNGDVMTTTLAGGPLQTIGSFSRTWKSHEDQLLVDARSIWLGTRQGVFEMPRAGGAERQVDATGVGAARMVAADDALVFATVDAKKLVKLDKATRSARVLAEGFGGISGLAVDGANVVVSDEYANTVSSIPLSGGAPVVIAKDQARPVHVAIGPEHVYWMNLNGKAGEVALVDTDGKPFETMRKRRDGTGAVEKIGVRARIPEATLAVDEREVYTDGEDGIYGMATSGGEARKLVRGPTADFVLVQDRLVAVEDHGFFHSKDLQSRPNRVLSARR